MSTPTHHKASRSPQPYPSPLSSSPSPLPPISTTSPPSTTNLAILPCTPSSLPYLLPLLTTTIPLNPFTALMLKQSHNTNPTAHLNLATWLYTAALQDPRAKIIALVAVKSEEDQPPKPDSTSQPSTPVTPTGIPPGNRPPKKPHARVVGIAWLQHFLPNEEWSTRYPIHLDKRSRKTPHLIIDTKAYARALKLLYTHRETCVGEQGGWYIRNIAADPAQGNQDVIYCHLLEYVGEMFGRDGRDGKGGQDGRDGRDGRDSGDGEGVVFWQAPPFRAAAGLYEKMGWRWGMCGGRVVEGGEGAGEGLDWVGWVCRGRGGGEGKGGVGG